jgi:hypothetical protein
MRLHIATWVLVLVGAGAAQTNTPGTPVASAPRLTPAQRQLNIDSFEQVWTTVRDKHWDPKLGGLDWQAVHDELRPKVDKAATMGEAREAMSEMLHRLKQTHFGIVPV